jgi:hypothetical protein
MKQSTLRMVIFGLWVGFAGILTLAVCIAPAVRSGPPPVLDSGETLTALRSVSGIWLPAVSCLAAFWFPKSERRQSVARVVPTERLIGALVLTAGYLLYALLHVSWVTYVVDYSNVAAVSPAGTSFLERLHEAVNYSLLLSPVALAPMHWLTQGSR